MRAMVLDAPRPVEDHPLRLKQVPEPSPGPGEIRVRTRVCGVCHTDLHIVEGELPMHKLPVVPGHQVVGVVDAVGHDVKEFREGDRAGEQRGAFQECAAVKRSEGGRQFAVIG